MKGGGIFRKQARGPPALIAGNRHCRYDIDSILVSCYNSTEPSL